MTLRRADAAGSSNRFASRRVDAGRDCEVLHHVENRERCDPCVCCLPRRRRRRRTRRASPRSSRTSSARMGWSCSSDDVQLDGTNHAAHFNSAFQSEFRLVNIALTSQLAAIPLPSPGSGFTYTFDSGSGTFVSDRHELRADPRRTRRNDRPRPRWRSTSPISRSRSIISTACRSSPFRPCSVTTISQLGGGRTDVVATMNTIESTVSQFSGAVTYGVTDRFDVSLGVPVVNTTAVAAVERHDSPRRHRLESRRCTTSRIPTRSAATVRRSSSSPRSRRAASATWSCGPRRR